MQNEIEKKYYNEKISEKHIRKHYKALLKYNKNCYCHSPENFKDLYYIINIIVCNFANLNKTGNITLNNIQKSSKNSEDSKNKKK